MSTEEFKRGAQRYRDAHPAQRSGQAWFNYLHQVRPELADLVRGGDSDPFHDDRRLGYFLRFVETAWTPSNPEIGP